jgi:hypothetical protein
MALHNFLTNRQANASARICRAAVQALKHQEDTLGILWINADAVVPHRKNPVMILTRHPHMHVGWLIAMELDGITDQVLEQLDELARIRCHHWQRIAGDQCSVFLYQNLEIAQGLSQDNFAIDQR